MSKAGGPRLVRLDALPPGLLAADATQLAGLLGGPTLIDLPGRRPEPLCLTVLLHGNEATGWDALRAVLARHAGRELPRALTVFIGNVEAAAQRLRRLPGQPDYNRCWPGTEDPGTPEAAMMREVVAHMAARRPFASIDIHNNTGLNPHYACVVGLDGPSLHLARLFGRIAVLFSRPLGVQAAALASVCPAITVECGVVGNAGGVEHAAQLIEAALHLSVFPAHAVRPHDLALLQTLAIVRVPAHASFSFDEGPADIRLRADIDHLNFGDVPPGTVLGRLAPGSRVRLEVIPAHDDGANARPLPAFFDYAGDEIRLARRVVPAMLTRDPLAVRNDCLCYLMHTIA
jgi:hypothetical protein